MVRWEPNEEQAHALFITMTYKKYIDLYSRRLYARHMSGIYCMVAIVAQSFFHEYPEMTQNNIQRNIYKYTLFCPVPQSTLRLQTTFANHV